MRGMWRWRASRRAAPRLLVSFGIDRRARRAIEYPASRAPPPVLPIRHSRVSASASVRHVESERATRTPLDARWAECRAERAHAHRAMRTESAREKKIADRHEQEHKHRNRAGGRT